MICNMYINKSNYSIILLLLLLIIYALWDERLGSKQPGWPINFLAYSLPLNRYSHTLWYIYDFDCYYLPIRDRRGNEKRKKERKKKKKIFMQNMDTGEWTRETNWNRWLIR